MRRSSHEVRDQKSAFSFSRGNVRTRSNPSLLSTHRGPYRGFTSILPTNSQYDTNYFLNYYGITGTQPQGPDGDAMD
jgi:hypothetical protein